MPEGMSVLGLFDGIATGLQALKDLGLPVRRYLASEICPFASRVAKGNHPEIIQLGSVSNVKPKDIGPVDLIMGGPPCQSFSIAGDRKGFNDPRGNMVLQYVQLVQAIKPRWFMMENVVMRKECSDIITGLLGVKPIELNSSAWSAQQRKRLYWTNLPLRPYKPDRCLVLADIMKCKGLAWLPKGWGRKDKPIRSGEVNKGGQGDRIYHPSGKAITLNAFSGGTAGSGNMLVGGNENWRKLSIEECERLQTLPDGYTRFVPLRARHRILGNCWTKEVICYLLSNLEGKK